MYICLETLIMKYHFDNSLGRISLQISKALGKSFEQKTIHEGFPLRADQWTLVSLLYHKGALTQKEIADSLYMDKVAVSRLVERMAVKGMVARRPMSNDKRAREVSLTSSGKKLYYQMEPLATKTIADALDGLNEETISDFFSKLNHIRKNLQC